MTEQNQVELIELMEKLDEIREQKQMIDFMTGEKHQENLVDMQ